MGKKKTFLNGNPKLIKRSLFDFHNSIPYRNVAENPQAKNQEDGASAQNRHGVPENQQHGLAPENQPEHHQDVLAPENQPEHHQDVLAPENQPEHHQVAAVNQQQVSAEPSVPPVAALEDQQQGIILDSAEPSVPSVAALEDQQQGIILDSAEPSVPSVAALEDQQQGIILDSAEPSAPPVAALENRQQGIILDSAEPSAPPVAALENRQQVILFSGEPSVQNHEQPPKKSLRHLTFQNSRDPTCKGEVRVLTYNILSDWIATKAPWRKLGQYDYCPKEALEWESRKKALLKEIVGYNADIICLQEVQENHFKNFFRSEFDQQGYSALYKRKQRGGGSVPSKEIGTLESVQHGCATFYKRALFNETGRLEIDFSESAEELIEKLPEEQRLDAVKEIKKDNIAIVVILEKIVPKEEHFDGSQICVANTHIHYNEKFRTAKLFQVMDLINKLERLTPLEVPLLICGDFNSLPLSDPYNFITNGKLSTKDYRPPYPNYLKSEHSFGLKSAYSRMCHEPVKEEQLVKMDNKSQEPLFTTCTSDFKGTIDYIFYTDKRLKVVDLLELLSPEDVIPGIPSDNWPSDHIALMGVFVQDPTAKNSDKNDSVLPSIGNSPIIKVQANLLNRKGCVVWITGFSGSGKSSVAGAIWSILNYYGKQAYVLDEDIDVSFGNSFEGEDHAENIMRTGEKAKLIADGGDVCIVSFISPYKRDRDACRALLPAGHFIEVFMNIPLHECKARDPNSLYKLARAGIIKNLAGFDVPYELSSNCEIVLRYNGPFAMGEEVVFYLRDKGFL